MCQQILKFPFWFVSGLSVSPLVHFLDVRMTQKLSCSILYM